MTSARRCACKPGRWPLPTRYVHLRATSSRCQRKMVSGVTRVATCASRWRPRRCPNSAKRRRSWSSNCSRCPASLVFSSRFSSRRNAMTSACSRWSHPPNTAINNWNGSTVEVYASAADPSVGHYPVRREWTATFRVGSRTSWEPNLLRTPCRAQSRAWRQRISCRCSAAASCSRPRRIAAATTCAPGSSNVPEVSPTDPAVLGHVEQSRVTRIWVATAATHVFWPRRINELRLLTAWRRWIADRPGSRSSTASGFLAADLAGQTEAGEARLWTLA